jgi:hypothetical protein
MKTLIATLFFLFIGHAMVFAQADPIQVDDTLKSSRKTNTFSVRGRFNYNTIMFDSLNTTDSIKIWHRNNKGRKFQISLKSLNTWSDLSTNLITGLSGPFEFFIVNPYLYDIYIEYLNTSITKTIKTTHRGKNNR